MKDNSTESIGDKISMTRKNAKVSQEDLAEILNVSRQAVSNWERSKSQPDISTILKICGYFGVKLDDFVRGEYSAEANNKNSIKEERSIMNNKEHKEKNKYQIAIGLFYAISLFLGLGIFFVVGLIYNQPMIWAAALFAGGATFFVLGLLSHAIITLTRKDKQ